MLTNDLRHSHGHEEIELSYAWQAALNKAVLRNFRSEVNYCVLPLSFLKSKRCAPNGHKMHSLKNTFKA